MTAPDLSAELCTRCALCCNGALFDFGPLDPEEVPQARANSLTVLEAEDKYGFGFPCPALAGSVCTVHPSRPDTCRAFRCRLLREAEAGTIAPDAALSIIADTRAAHDALLGQLPPGSTIIDARRWRRRAGEADANALAIAPPQVMIALGMLDLLLDQHFRKPGDRQVLPRC